MIKLDTSYKKDKPKREYSKIFMTSLLIFTLVLVTLSYILSFMDKNPVESLSTSIIEKVLNVDFLCFAFYIIQNSVRAWTLNKYCGGVLPEQTSIKDNTEETVYTEDNKDICLDEILSKTGGNNRGS